MKQTFEDVPLPMWGDPKPGEVVRFDVGRQTAGPDGKVSKKRGTSYIWLACSVCGELILTKGLAPDQARLEDADYAAKHGRPCRMTPKCPGRHLVSDPSKPFKPLYLEKR